jgi:hypothetical protein
VRLACKSANEKSEKSSKGGELKNKIEKGSEFRHNFI